VLVERRETLGTDAWEQLHWKTLLKNDWVWGEQSCAL